MKKIVSFVVDEKAVVEGEEIFTRTIDETTTQTRKIVFERDREHPDGFRATAEVIMAGILLPIPTNDFYSEEDKGQIRGLFELHDQKAIADPAKFLKTRQATKEVKPIRKGEKI